MNHWKVRSYGDFWKMVGANVKCIHSVVNRLTDAKPPSFSICVALHFMIYSIYIYVCFLNLSLSYHSYKVNTSDLHTRHGGCVISVTVGALLW